MVTTSTDLTGAQRSALVLLSLGEDVATDIFRNLNQKEIRDIGMALETVQTISPTVVDEVYLQFAEEVKHDSGFLMRGGEFLEEVATRVMGPEKARNLMAHLKRQTKSSVENLSEADPQTLANVIRKEHPQTIALLLAHTVTNKASSIIPLLPEELQVEVVLRIAKLENVTPDILNEVEQAIQDEILSMGNIESTNVGGVEMVAEMLNNMEKTYEKNILDELSETQPELADRIRQKMFTFDDLINVDGRGIQQILKEIENETLVIALKATSEELKCKIFGNMSKRAASMVEEDLQTKGPMRLSEVERAQMQIVNIAMRLEEEGKIIIAGGEGEDVLV